MCIGIKDEDRLCLLVHYYNSDRAPIGVNNYSTIPLREDFIQGVYTHKWPDKQANGYLPDGRYVIWPRYIPRNR